MARAITWQDVEAPRQAANIEVAMRAGRMLQDSVAGMGNVATGIYDETRKVNTEAAVASIANSADPMAAAAAAPQGWQFDPLAIAGAANARTDQLLDTKVKNSNLLENEAQIANMKSIQEDRESNRQIARMVEPYTALARSGKDYKIDTTDPVWETPAGFEARKYLDGLSNEAFNRRAENERLAQGRAAARAAEFQMKRELDKEDFFSWARERGATATADMMDQKTLDRDLVAEAKRRGLPAQYADQASAFFMKGQEANTASDLEMRQQAPGSKGTYQDALDILSTVKADTEAQIAARRARPYDERNPDNPDPNRPSLLQLSEVANRGPGFTEGPIGFVAAELAAKADISDSEARERITDFQAEYRHLSTAQAADLAFQTKDRWNALGIWNATKAPEAKAGALIYREVDRLGGKEGVARLDEQVTAPLKRTLAEVGTTARQLSGSARAGQAIPEKIIEWDQGLAKARKAATNKEAAEEAAAAEKAMIEAQRRATIAERH